MTGGRARQHAEEKGTARMSTAAGRRHASTAAGSLPRLSGHRPRSGTGIPGYPTSSS